MKTCEQCFEEYAAGTGATEPGPSRYQLTERFCSETCARQYIEEITGDA